MRNYLAVHEDVTAVRQEQWTTKPLRGQPFRVQKLETIGTAGGIAHDFNDLDGILGSTRSPASPPEDPTSVLQRPRRSPQGPVRAKDLAAQDPHLGWVARRDSQQVLLEPCALRRRGPQARPRLHFATIEIERDLQPAASAPIPPPSTK